MPFVKFPAQQHTGDVYVNSDFVASVDEIPGSLTIPAGSRVRYAGGGFSNVKGLPEEVVSDLEDATCDGCEFNDDVKFELTPLAEEMLKQAGKTHAASPPDAKVPPTLIPDLHNEIALLKMDLAAFRADAKCADERAEWFKKLAEERLVKLTRAQSQATHQIEDYRALGRSIIAKKDEEIRRLNAELALTKSDKEVVDRWYGELVDRHADKMAEMREIAAELAEWRDGKRVANYQFQVTPIYGHGDKPMPF